MLIHLAKFLLLPSQWFIILPLIIYGLFTTHKKIFYHASCAILLSMLINIALKITFAIPLSPNLNKTGFAFPSGHMQQAMVFYGWLTWNWRCSFFRLFMVAILLIGIGFGLVFLGYHNYADVSAGIFFGTFVLFFYHAFIVKKPQWSSLTLIITSSGILLYCYYKTGYFSLFIKWVFVSLCILAVAPGLMRISKN